MRFVRERVPARELRDSVSITTDLAARGDVLVEVVYEDFSALGVTLGSVCSERMRPYCKLQSCI